MEKETLNSNKTNSRKNKKKIIGTIIAFLVLIYVVPTDIMASIFAYVLLLGLLYLIVRTILKLVRKQNSNTLETHSIQDDTLNLKLETPTPIKTQEPTEANNKLHSTEHSSIKLDTPVEKINEIKKPSVMKKTISNNQRSYKTKLILYKNKRLPASNREPLM